jgi:N-carbamoyl-L-amino-acid hydrolase
MEPDDEAFLADFRDLARIGATAGGGVERQAGSAADLEQRAWFADWLVHRGFSVHYDQVGNQYGLLEITPGRPWVLTGSHLDSQPLAGRFDGAYGVLASAHAADRLRREWAAGASSSALNLAVVNWFNEEGSRFKPSMMGSSALVGNLLLDVALETADSQGHTVREVLEPAGMLGDPVLDSPGLGVCERGGIASYAEIHIEQGRRLEKTGTEVGIVEGTWAAHKFEILVKGAQSHTGATVMADRRDALLGAAMLITRTRELADGAAAPLHASVSELYVEPNSPVTVAREVRMHFDFRSEQQAIVDAGVAELWAYAAEVETRTGVQIIQVAEHRWDRRDYARAGLDLAEECATSLGLSSARLLTLAGHDSTNMSQYVPTVMLFVPSREGISHNEAEDTGDIDAVQGVRMLTAVLRRLADDALG